MASFNLDFDKSVILDTGASNHITNNKNFILNKQMLTSSNIIMIDGLSNTETCYKIGKIKFTTLLKKWGETCPSLFKFELDDCNYCKNSPYTLISFQQLNKIGWKLSENADEIFHKDFGSIQLITIKDLIFFVV